MQVDYEARLKKIQAKMDEQAIDVLIATRLSTAGYVVPSLHFLKHHIA
jgi:hypothetical protein